MSRSNENNFTIGNFFKLGSFRPEDKAVLESACSNEAVPLAQLPPTACNNLIAMPSDSTQLDDNAWISEFTMDVVLNWLQTKYPAVYFIESMLWSNPMSHVSAKIKADLDKIRARRYFASCLCRDSHWYWLLYDSGTETLLYGDNYNGASENQEVKKLISSLFFYICGMTNGAKAKRPTWVSVKCPEFLDDINNCGAYALCSLLMGLESDCDPTKLSLLFDLGLVKQENMPFIRYRLAMCIALQTLEVPIDYFENLEVDHQFVPYDNFLTPILEFDQNFFESAKKEEEAPFQPEEWATPIVVADLTLPQPLAEPKVWILYFISTKPGISAADLLTLCSEKGIEKATMFYHVNMVWRHDEGCEKIPKANRIVRQHNGLYYATVAALHYFAAWELSYSRFDRLTLKKKNVRRVSKKKAAQLLLSDGKVTRPYKKSGLTIPWEQAIRELTNPYVIPMTTNIIKRLFQRKYPDSEVLKLPEQKITLRILQGIEMLKKDRQGRGRKREPVQSGARSVRLQGDIVDVVQMDNIISVISAMSANLRAACVEYFRFSDTRGLTFYDGQFVTLNDNTDFKDILRRANLAHNTNLARASEYIDYLKREVLLRDRRAQFVEFIIRIAITKDIETIAHFKSLFFCDSVVEILFVTTDYVCTDRERIRGRTSKKQKVDACTKYITSMKYLLYANQCKYNCNSALSWEKLTLYDEAQERLICTLDNHHNLLGVDREGYLILREPIYYGSLIELPTEEFDSWFARINYHTDPLQQICHARYVQLYDRQYLECNYNLKAGMRFFHDL